MNRVEIVNLGGRAHHIESAGATAIDAWLEAARVSLNGDPDRDDLLQDFERAIGEKCDALLIDGRDVVTTEEIAAILDSLGTIEPSEDDALASPTSTARPVEERPRRLYRLPDERMIAGVCSGVAAWMRVDVTVARVGWVVLPLLLAGPTDGAAVPLAVAVYALLAFTLPRADSPEAIAAAHGHGVTAQDRLLQARSGATPALAALGSRLGQLVRGVLRIARVLVLIAIAALLAVWVVATVWLAVAGDPALTAFDEDISSWLGALLLTCVAVILVAPLGAFVAIVDQGIRASAHGRLQLGRLTLWLVSATAAWVAAATIAVVVAATVPEIRDILADGEGRITVRDTTYCFAAGADTAHCMPGDEIVR
jgi:phage shock protein PspC (stress-responsive transcriptional regulator)